MRMNQKVALIASAGLGMVFLAACSDSATAPRSDKFVSEVSLAVGGTTTSAPQVTILKICKTGDVSGVFTITDVGDGTGGNGNPAIIADQNGALPGSQHTLTPGPDATPNCVEAATSTGNATLSQGDFFTVTETSAAGVTTTMLCNDGGGAGFVTCPANFFINSVHGWTVLVDNTAPTPGGCTYTKGWYRNNGSDDVTAVDTRTAADARAIFDATPGKPGNVTWQGGNDVLNLYQQLMAAILNGGVTSGNAGVMDAISDGLAATGEGATALSITYNAGALDAGTTLGDLIARLSNFNEGNVAGFPHCDD